MMPITLSNRRESINIPNAALGVDAAQHKSLGVLPLHANSLAFGREALGVFKDTPTAKVDSTHLRAVTEEGRL